MSIRTRYISGRSNRPAAEHHVNQSPPQPPAGTNIISQAKNAAKRFTKYVEKNQRDYIAKTGDKTPWTDNLIRLPARVLRETSRIGREEEARIRKLKCKESGRSGKCVARSRESLEFELKPKKKPKPKKVISFPYDPEAEVG